MDSIKKTLKQIEEENNVKIIFASELGSRAWRMESADSDYDVRFVFKRPLKDYLKLNKSPEVINLMKGEEDYVGFDVYKFLGLINSSNPSAIEWLLSDIHYIDKPPKKMLELIEEYYNSIALYHHYKSMAKQNYINYLKSGVAVSYKKYLYAMRGLLNSIYVTEYKKIPSIQFPQTIELLNKDKKIPTYIYDKLKEIIRIKKSGQEKEKIQNIVKIDEYIEKKLKENNEPEPTKKHGLLNEINKYLQKEI